MNSYISLKEKMRSFIIIILFFIPSIFMLKLEGSKDYFKDNIEKIEPDIAIKALNDIHESQPIFEIQMDHRDIKFLNGLIRKYKPKKLLELGVYKGGSSSIILNSIKDIDGSFLYSIDSSKYCFLDKKIPVGYYAIKTFPKLMNKWKLFTGGIPAEFIEQIGDGIDFAFFDTSHVMPGEALDFLQVLPFLKKNAIIVFHDISLFIIGWDNKRFTRTNFSNNLLFTYIKGEKLFPVENIYNKNQSISFPNIGAIILDDNQQKYLFDYFFALNFYWEYFPYQRQIDIIKKHFNKYYGKFYNELFEMALKYNKIFTEVNPNIDVVNLYKSYNDIDKDIIKNQDKDNLKSDL